MKKNDKLNIQPSFWWILAASLVMTAIIMFFISNFVDKNNTIPLTLIFFIFIFTGLAISGGNRTLKKK